MKMGYDLEGWAWEGFSLINAMCANIIYIIISFRKCRRLLALKVEEDVDVLQLFSKKISLFSEIGRANFIK